MLVAWTTVGTQADADRIAAAAVESGLAVCVQIEGPITSVYRWEGRITREQEYRLCFKLKESTQAALEQQVLALHPYETPEWIAVEAHRVGEKYLCWATANSTN